MLNKILLSIIISLLLIGVLACSSTDIEVPKEKPVKNSDSPNNSESVEAVKIKSSDGNLVAEITTDGQIEFGGKKLTKQRKNAEKVIYSLDGNQLAEVKTKDADGFKVRDLNGKLLWKIKVSPDKIKISDNEENANPFEIKKREDGAKVVYDETKLGEVKFNAVGKKIKVKNGEDKEVFESRTDKQSIAYGVLLLDKIPEELRFMIMAELFSRNL